MAKTTKDKVAIDKHATMKALVKKQLEKMLQLEKNHTFTDKAIAAMAIALIREARK